MLESIRTLRAHLSDVNIRIFEFRYHQMDYKQNKKKNRWKCDVKILELKQKSDGRPMMCLGRLWQNIPQGMKTAYKIRSRSGVEILFNRNNPLSLGNLIVIYCFDSARSYNRWASTHCVRPWTRTRGNYNERFSG